MHKGYCKKKYSDIIRYYLGNLYSPGEGVVCLVWGWRGSVIAGLAASGEEVVPGEFVLAGRSIREHKAEKES